MAFEDRPNLFPFLQLERICRACCQRDSQLDAAIHHHVDFMVDTLNRKNSSGENVLSTQPTQRLIRDEDVTTPQAQP